MSNESAIWRGCRSIISRRKRRRDPDDYRANDQTERRSSNATITAGSDGGPGVDQVDARRPGSRGEAPYVQAGRDLVCAVRPPATRFLARPVRPATPSAPAIDGATVAW